MSSSVKNTYSFPSGKFYLKFKTAIITGVGRSGKTTLGNVLATNKNAEYCEEPWILNLLPAMVKLKIIDKERGGDMFNTYLHELMNEMILLRQVNFRPNDDSSIWTKKTRAEISLRLKSLQSRADIKNFVKKNKPIFLMILRESLLFNPAAIFDFLPDCKIIHVVRKGLDVAYDIKEKGWLSDKNLMRPPHARIYYPLTHRGKVFYVPCWIDPKDGKKFLGYSEYERALFYWCSLMESAIESFKKFEKKNQCMTIKFEEFIKNPRKIMQKANSFLKMRPSSITEKALRKIGNNPQICEKTPELPKELLIRTKKIYRDLGYDWI